MSVQPLSSAVSTGTGAQCSRPNCSGQLQQIDHVSRAGLLAGSRHERLPDLIKALRAKDPRAAAVPVAAIPLARQACE